MELIDTKYQIMSDIIKCPKCKSSNVKQTTIGSVEQGATYVVAGVGIAALKFGAHLMGLRTMTPKMSAVKSGTDELGIPRQYECCNCGEKFHARKYH